MTKNIDINNKEEKLPELFPGQPDLNTENLKKISKIKSNKKPYAQIEGNLLEYPIAIFNKKGKASFVEGNYVVYKDQEGNELSRVGTSYGVLTSFDENIFVGMMQFKKKVNDKYVLAFSDYSLLKLLNIKRNGPIYELLEKSKKKIATMNLTIPRFISFMRNGKGEKEKTIIGKENYSVFQASYLSTRSTTAIETNPLHFNYYVINSLIADNLDLKYRSYIDIELRNKLPSPVVKRIYAYLTKKKGVKPYYEEDIKSFCAKLPIETKNITSAISILKDAFECLKKENIIADYNIGKGAEDKLKVGIHFHRGKPKPTLLPVTIKGKQAEMFDRLIKNGVDQDKAIRIVRTKDLDIIKRQLDWLPYRNITENKPGMLYKAIIDNWSIPKEAEDRLIDRNNLYTKTQENKEGIEAIENLTDLVVNKKIEPSPIMNFIAKNNNIQRAQITLAEIEQKFKSIKTLSTTADEYWQGAKSIITRYSKNYSEVELKSLADKYKL